MDIVCVSFVNGDQIRDITTKQKVLKDILKFLCNQNLIFDEKHNFLLIKV